MRLNRVLASVQLLLARCSSLDIYSIALL